MFLITGNLIKTFGNKTRFKNGRPCKSGLSFLFFERNKCAKIMIA